MYKKKFKIASERRRIKSISQRLKDIGKTSAELDGVKTEAPKVIHFWYLFDKREDRWRDFPQIRVDNGKPKPRVKDISHEAHLQRVATPKFKLFHKVDRVRLADMERLMWEDYMENEIEKRAGPLPPVQWRPGGNFTWTPDLDQALLEHVANGGTFTSFAKRMRCSRSAVVARAAMEDIAPMIDEALSQGADAMAEMALEIASSPDMVEQIVETVDGLGNVRERHTKTCDAVDSRKLAFQARMQLLSKIAPNRYGEKPEMKQSNSMAQQIMKARARIREAD